MSEAVAARTPESAAPGGADGMSALRNDVEAFVKECMAGNDSSHDWFHVHRVRVMALRLAEEEGVEDKQAVELAALLHDVSDWKYGDSGALERAKAILREHSVSEEAIAKIESIIDNIGFKEELAVLAGGGKLEVTPELAVVQDADRLDAIGAVGIGRCLTYGAAKGRVLWDPAQEARLGMTKEEYMAHVGTTMNHFPEKLFRLAALMKSDAGKRVAEERHAFMKAFFDRFMAECRGEM